MLDSKVDVDDYYLSNEGFRDANIGILASQILMYQ